MRILSKIVVDELPESCNDCVLREDNYCSAKGCFAQDSTWVNDWSAGCTVFKRVKDFDEFMKIVKKARKIHGNSFTYTVINSNDIK